MTLAMLYVPTNSLESASLIAKTMLEERLIVCANIIPSVSTLYLWEGKIEEATEFVMVIKLQRNNVEKARIRVAELHPYSIPCIAEIKLDSINSCFAEWANNQG